MRRWMDAFINGIEWIAAIFVGLVAADIFFSVMLRASSGLQVSLFGKPYLTMIPDGYDIGKMLLGILIFWGIAATSYRGSHITVDLVWAAANLRWKRVIDVFATLAMLFVVAVQTYTLYDKVAQTRIDNVLTFDLHMPTWPFFALAWIGDVSAVILIAIRTWQLVREPGAIDVEPQLKAVE